MGHVLKDVKDVKDKVIFPEEFEQKLVRQGAQKLLIKKDVFEKRCVCVQTLSAIQFCENYPNSSP